LGLRIGTYPILLVLIIAAVLVAYPENTMPSTKIGESGNGTSWEFSFFTFGVADEDLLLETSVSMLLHDEIAGTYVNATLTFRFACCSDSGSVGYKQDFLEVENGPDAVPVVGLSYTRKCEYLFAYLGTQELFDEWGSGQLGCITENGQHPYPLWTPDSTESQNVGPIPVENVSQSIIVGYVVEYDDLTLYFSNDEYILCGPKTIAAGMNFTLDGEWSMTPILEVSDTSNVVLDERSIDVSLEGHMPIDPDWLPTSDLNGELQSMLFPSPVVMILIMAVGVVAVVVAVLCKRAAKTK